MDLMVGQIMAPNAAPRNLFVTIVISFGARHR